MKQILLNEKIGNLREDTMLMIRYMLAAERLDSVKFPETFSELTLEISTRAEKIACATRSTVYFPPDIVKTDAIPNVAEAQGITVSYNKQWLMVTLPILLPKRTQKSIEFLTAPLLYALRNFTTNHPVPQLEKAVFCFRHIYDRNAPPRHIRDYDNVQEKPVLDILALFTAIDDTGRLCNVFNVTDSGDVDCTEVFAMAPDVFLSWQQAYGIV